MEIGTMQKQTVTIDGVGYDYPRGTPFRRVAADFQDRYPDDILLVNRDGKLCDITPTMLDLMGLQKPKDMTGETLIES